MKNGFANMDPARLKEISRKGQAALQAKGTRYKFTSETARAAALKARAAAKQPADVTANA